MFQQVIQSIQQYGTFSEEELARFVSYLQPATVAKDEVILMKGETCQTLSFVLQGSFLQSFLDEELDKKVVNLFVKNDWVLNHSSFTAQKPSLHQIEAFQDSEILSISIHQVHELISRFPSFFALGKILEVVSPNQDSRFTPDEKYLHLLTKKPMLVQTFPLKYIASYLGMTPETLSRVRSRID